MEYLRKEDILQINQMTVERHGGNFVPPANLLNEAPLDYLIEAVQSTMFGEELYPELSQKAGLYMFNIISNHMFQDGNKRTGLGAALLFLKINGYRLVGELKALTQEQRVIPERGSSSNEILIAFTLEVAAGKVNLEECQKWFELNVEKIKE